ncbi:hypothetical protein MTZ49_11060 [Entomomonas sp. E2T0]|uniref:class I SAM-dependent methyltransferase n=1 Tax=Entomomonas sp. E2T0 TaxID=2930213 RepID=UPI0022280F46|nr:methyltransferase domain-containing protein [Entomomonas sp. E2T0]UYZ83137.1 hypothetical protein MTZ49_11060 [Entomomonas sp. E2T0]
MTQIDCQLNPMAIYAEGVDSSDYIDSVAPLIIQTLVNIGDLLDVGAGGGQLGSSLQAQNNHWVAIEPDPYMCDRLHSYPNCTRVIPTGWKEVHNLSSQSFDTVLAANMIAPQADAINFLERCRSWTRNAIVWIVPSQRGPKGLCLSGCLPNEWVQEGNETGYERVMSQLSESDYPNHTLTVDWTFTYITRDIDIVATHMANQLGWDINDTRRLAMGEHLYSNSIQDGLDFYLKVPKQSTILIWENQ